MAEPNFIQDINSILSAIQAARGTKNTTTRSNNVTPEQAQALMQDMLKSSGGLRDIIASHRSSGLRSSSGQQAAVENLMAKVAAEGAKASSKETVVQQGAGVTRGNEAKILAGLAAATPILKPIVSPLWDAASKKYQDWASSAFGSTDTGADLVGPSAEQISAFDSFGTLGTSGADYAADAIDYSAPLYSEAFSTWGSLGSSMAEDAAVDWGGSAAADMGSSMMAARGGLIINTGASAAPQARPQIRVTPTLSNYSDGSRSFGNYGSAAPSNVAPDGFVQGYPEYAPFAPTVQQFLGNLAEAAVLPAAKNAALDAPVTPIGVLQFFRNVAKLNAKDSAKNKADQFEAAFKNEMQFKHENPDYAMPVVAEQAVNNADVSNIGYTDSGAGAGYTGGGPGASIGGGWGNSGGFGPSDSGASGAAATSTAAKGGSVQGDSKPGVDDSLVALDGGEYVIPADVVATLGVDKFDQLLSTFGYKPRRVKGVPI